MKKLLLLPLILFTTSLFALSDVDLLKRTEEYEKLVINSSNSVDEYNNYISDNYSKDKYKNLFDIMPFLKGIFYSTKGSSNIINTPLKTGYTDKLEVNISWFYNKYKGNKDFIKDIDKYISILDNNITVFNKNKTKIDKNIYSLYIDSALKDKDCLTFLKDILEN